MILSKIVGLVMGLQDAGWLHGFGNSSWFRLCRVGIHVLIYPFW